MSEDRRNAAEADEDGGERIAVAMELRNHGVTELRKHAAWLRTYGNTEPRRYGLTEAKIDGDTEIRTMTQEERWVA